MRKDHPVLSNGTISFPDEISQEQSLSYHISNGVDGYLVVHNLGKIPLTFLISEESQLISAETAIRMGKEKFFHLQPYGSVVIKVFE